MIEVLLFRSDDPNAFAERQWPAVPRVGETVVMPPPGGGAFEVVGVVWDDQRTGLVARVHLRPMD